VQSYVPRQPVKERKSCNNKVGNAEKQGPIPSIMPLNAPEIASDLIQIMAGNRILGQAGPKGPKEQEPMRLTTRTNLAIRTLMYCAANPGVVVRKSDIAKACDASENHLGQVIHLLAQRKFIVTHRGRFGGMTLARAPREISIGAVFRSLEQGLPFADCLNPTAASCPLAGACRLTAILCEALEAFYDRLDAVSLADLTDGNSALQELLRAG
jgi:Rrf2 family transcriptional regulator, nitric oxide-sensitive transcriptional repressor